VGAEALIRWQHSGCGLILPMDFIPLGVGFSLDDFGTGYSSLSYLTHLPFDQLKINRSFVHNAGANHTDSVIEQTLIGMTSNLLDMQIIAEGVETEDYASFWNTTAAACARDIYSVSPCR